MLLSITALTFGYLNNFKTELVMYISSQTVDCLYDVEYNQMCHSFFKTFFFVKFLAFYYSVLSLVNISIKY